MKLSLKTLLFVATIFCCAITSRAQTSWEKLFSRTSTDAFRNVAECPSGGYIAVGYTSSWSPNDTDAYVVRLNTSGDTIWTRRINGTGSRKDLLYKVINTNDGNYAMCGYSTSYGAGTEDVLIIKMDDNGNILWTKTWGGTGRDRAQEIVQTSDNGYIVCGYTTSPPAQYFDGFLLKLNASGDTTWSRRYGTALFEDFNSVKQLADGGYIAGGQGNNGGNGLDQYLVRTNSSGDTTWTKRFGTLGTDNIEYIHPVADGFLLAGGTDGTGSDGNNGYIVKTDLSGVVVWTKVYGGSLADDFHEIEPTLDGNFILSGTTSSSGPIDPNMWMFKVDANGDSIWARTYGGNNHDHGYSAMPTSDGGYIFAGYSSSFGFNYEEAYLVKTDANGLLSNFLTYITIFSLASPLEGVCGNATQQVKVVLRNFGRDTVPNIPITVNITGAITQTLNFNYAGPLFPEDADTVTFLSTINTSGGGAFNFGCVTGTTNDVYPANNRFDTTRTIIAFSTAPTTTGAARCGPGSVTLSASATDPILWYSASTGGALLGSGNTYNTPSISSTTTYYAQAGSTCPSNRVAAVATINTAVADPVTTGADRCGSGSLTLTATASDPVTWWDAASGGTQVGTGNSFVTPNLTTTTTYYAQASNGPCSSARIPTVATINTQPNTPTTTGAFNCGPGSVTLGASSSASLVTWWDAASGGNQVATGLSYTTPVLSSTTTYYVEASNGTCPSSARASVVATIRSITPDPGTSGGARCGSGTVTLSATSAQTLIWYSSPGGAQVGVGASFTTPFLTTSTTYYVQATDGFCPSQYVAVQAVINTPPSVFLGNDTTVLATSYQLNAGSGFTGYNWNSGAGTAQTFTVTTPGTYCVVVTDGNGCTATDCIFVDLITGINEQSDWFATVYPNPAHEQLTIRFGGVQPKTLSFRILHMNGQLVQETEHSELSATREISIPLNGLAAGAYLLQVRSDRGEQSIRFTVK